MLRGIAILLMVTFHVIFNMEVFFGYDFGYMEGFWYYLGRIAAILFILLVGVASSIITSRYSRKEAARKNIKRGLKLIGFGLLITLITRLLDPANTIWFGILHFLGVSILITIPLARLKELNLLLGSILLAAHYQVIKIQTGSYLGILFGIYPPTFQTYDHYALIPWLGYVLFGIALGNYLYPKGENLIKRDPNRPEKALTLTGRYSLWVYLIHQPVLMGLLWLILK